MEEVNNKDLTIRKKEKPKFQTQRSTDIHITYRLPLLLKEKIFILATL